MDYKKMDKKQILFTGVSSFTGYWFVNALADAGHHVTAIFRRPYGTYTGLRQQRIDQLAPNCTKVFDCEFGSDLFFDIVRRQERWDLFCHHAADVTNYKSPHFDIAAALENNTKNLFALFKLLITKGCEKTILTGSVFEQNEGEGSDELRAFSPYGLSKGLTSDVARFYAEQTGMRLGKFVIANPFGPYEEPRFTSYLMQNWLQGKTAAVNTPSYIRDNIHVSLLAQAYVYFAKKPVNHFEKFNPSGYVESQGAFTQRFAEQMRQRMGIACEYILANQTEFLEPRIRVNTDPLQDILLQWNEKMAWDSLADYYQRMK
jgi:UDP-glucose 4-epimerase